MGISPRECGFEVDAVFLEHQMGGLRLISTRSPSFSTQALLYQEGMWGPNGHAVDLGIENDSEISCIKSQENVALCCQC